MDRNYWWMDQNWRNDPLIQRSHNPALKQLALDTIRYQAEHSDNLQVMLARNCGIMGNHDRSEVGKTSTAVGHYLIPGSKTDKGVRCSSREIGAMIEYYDGRIEYQVFKMEAIYAECKAALQPVQKPQQLRLMGF